MRVLDRKDVKILYELLSTPSYKAPANKADSRMWTLWFFFHYFSMELGKKKILP